MIVSKVLIVGAFVIAVSLLAYGLVARALTVVVVKPVPVSHSVCLQACTPVNLQPAAGADVLQNSNSTIKVGN